jgi:hypothetical protein
MNSNTNPKKKIIRLLGYGQFYIDDDVLNDLNSIDNGIVKLLENKENNTDKSITTEFEKQLQLLESIVRQKGVAIESDKIVSSDIVMPGKDITMKEARNLFKGEGIIKDVY